MMSMAPVRFDHRDILIHLTEEPGEILAEGMAVAGAAFQRGNPMIDIPHKPQGGTGPFWRTPDEYDRYNPAGTVKEYSDEIRALGGGLLIYICCAFGHELRCVKNNHTILANGEILAEGMAVGLQPSWVCTVPGCTWHEVVRMLGWAGTP